MISDSLNVPFRYAIFISVALHIMAMAGLPFYGHVFPGNSKIGKIEISYIKEKEPEKPISKHEPKPEQNRSEKIIATGAHPAAITGTAKSTPSISMKTTTIKTMSREKAESKPVFAQGDKTVTKQAAIPAAETTASVDIKGLHLVSLSYDQAVRSKIISNLAAEDPREEGDVFVRFVILANGELKDLGIIDSKSSKNGILRGLAFEAVKNSSPFPRFPKDFLAPEVIFTVQIAFVRK